MKTGLDDKAREMLEGAGLYRTEARIAVLTALLEAHRPLRQNQIAMRLAEKALNKVTIYRTLESLVETGLVHRAFLQERAWHFELADHCTETQCHPHFTCLECEQTHCLTGISVPMAESPYNSVVPGIEVKRRTVGVIFDEIIPFIFISFCCGSDLHRLLLATIYVHFLYLSSCPSGYKENESKERTAYHLVRLRRTSLCLCPFAGCSSNKPGVL